MSEAHFESAERQADAARQGMCRCRCNSGLSMMGIADGGGKFVGVNVFEQIANSPSRNRPLH